jgi:hypothetical protein
MGSQLTPVPFTLFIHDEVNILTIRTTPVLKDVFGADNPVLVSQLLDAEKAQITFQQVINRPRESNHTPILNENNTSRFDAYVTLQKQLDSLIRRIRTKPQAAIAAKQLKKIVRLKCPSFLQSGYALASSMLNALEIEMSNLLNQDLASQAGVQELFTELFAAHDKFETANKVKLDDSSEDFPQIRAARNKLVNRLKKLFTNLDYLAENDPDHYQRYVVQINDITSEIIALMRSRKAKALKKEEKEKTTPPAKNTKAAKKTATAEVVKAAGNTKVEDTVKTEENANVEDTAKTEENAESKEESSECMDEETATVG